MTRQEQGVRYKPCDPVPYLTGMNPEFSFRCVFQEEPWTSLLLSGEAMRGRILQTGQDGSPAMSLRLLSHRYEN